MFLGICRPASTQEATTQNAIDYFDTLTLERTACFGNCPVYRIVVHADGVVEFTGMRYVKIQGISSGRLTSAQLHELVEAINRVKYFSLEDVYDREAGDCPTVATDFPTVISSVAIGNVAKTIRHNHGCRQASSMRELGEVYLAALTEFEARVDRIVDSVQWIGTSEEREKLED